MTGEDVWHDLMRRGDFEGAWQLCDRDLPLRRGSLRHSGPRHLQNIWDGTPIGGRTLVRCYHGLGDTLQFLRYIPRVAALAGDTAVWIQPALIDLVRSSLRDVRLIPLHDGSPDGAFDVDVEIMELPHVFRTTIATIPPPLRYLTRTRAPRPHAPVVGLKWSAGDWDNGRSLPFHLIEPLLALPRYRFISLEEQLTPHEQQWFQDEPTTDLLRLGRQIAGCDLIISVDSMSAHLAGSIGVPTWTLLKADADWRWLSARRDSPWYPSMRLYRQQTPGAWAETLDHVIEDLRRSLFD